MIKRNGTNQSGRQLQNPMLEGGAQDRTPNKFFLQFTAFFFSSFFSCHFGACAESRLFTCHKHGVDDMHEEADALKLGGGGGGGGQGSLMV